MKICYENPINEIKRIVESKAKYQKVMLLFDNSISNTEIREVYEAIKGYCIYNQANITDVNKTEIYNGYRLVIYLCEVDSLLKCDIDRSEFVNVYFVRQSTFLPFFLTQNNNIDNLENYLIADFSKVDFSMLSSVSFNVFYNYFRSLLFGQNFIGSFAMLPNVSNNYKVIDCINEMEQNSFFVDIDILKKCEIDYRDVVFVDLLLIDAITLLLLSIKSGNHMIVDIYKTGKDNYELIDKFYKLYNNKTFKELILLNFNCLYNFCLKTKQKIKEYVGFFEIDFKHIECIVEKLKLYAKNDNDIIAYLYLYNIFNV